MSPGALAVELRGPFIDVVQVPGGNVESALFGVQPSEPDERKERWLIAGAKRFYDTQQLILRRGVLAPQEQRAAQIQPQGRRQRRVRHSSHANLGVECASQQLLGFRALAEPRELHSKLAFGIVCVGMIRAT